MPLHNINNNNTLLRHTLHKSLASPLLKVDNIHRVPIVYGA